LRGIDLVPIRAFAPRRRARGAYRRGSAGDDRTRSREVDLLRYELGEIDSLGDHLAR